VEHFWQAALGVAGLGAVAAFVVWSIYKDWLKLPIFQQMEKEQQYSLFRLVIVLAFLFGVAGLATYLLKPSVPGGGGPGPLPSPPPLWSSGTWSGRILRTHGVNTPEWWEMKIQITEPFVKGARVLVDYDTADMQHLHPDTTTDLPFHVQSLIGNQATLNGPFDGHIPGQGSDTIKLMMAEATLTLSFWEGDHIVLDPGPMQPNH
jgi:hypothetical protein